MERSKSILSASALALYAHFALQLVAGVALSTAYGPERAYEASAALHRGGWGIVQGFHYWGSAVMIVHSILHLAGVTWAGWYRGPEARAYLAALALAGLSLAFQLTGNLLPGDRHGVQTAAIEASIAARVPVVGPAVSRLVLGGQGASERTVALWYDLHRFALPVGLLVALWLGMSVAQKKDARWPVAIPAVLALLLAFTVASPLGSAAMAADFGAFDAKPSWYTIPMHGLLVWGGWIGAMVVPAILALAFVLLPAFKPKPALARGLLMGIGALGLAAGLLSGGESAPLVGTRDPAPPESVAPSTAPVVKRDEKLAASGRALFKATGCNGCHGADGLKAVGGPSLANVWKTHPEADYYVRYIRAPQSVKKGSTMPAYSQLKQEELRALAEFLRFARN